ncbi:hypothetical protein GWO43_06665, partial [candidate division KSB1 bacterium]|nr:hypothetical protein [candidate division KSB1 bacterium]NIR72585.1 hypothetical protein [candidate division KSB1 bacterium]NIS23645.1 hypothetical protein [candidate division KSB1 bacterium]NIT70569.1 hypothetical protein [candidate division KSB1 bacterium]NIU24287.1 hypothetical protein [candidate division KSB1 bacterium]
MKKLFSILILAICVSIGGTHLFAQNVSNGFCWVEQESATGNAVANGIDKKETFDLLDAIFVTGEFQGTVTFDQNGPHETTFTSTSNNPNGFLARYDNDGNLQWVVKAGVGSDDVIPKTISVGEQIFVAGQFRGTATFGVADSIVSLGANDVFIAAFDLDGNFQWVRRGGSDLNDRLFDVLDDDFSSSVNDGPIITGFFRGDADFGTLDFSNEGRGDIFLVKYDRNGNVRWGKSFGSSDDDRGYGITRAVSNFFLCGEFSNEVDFGGGNVVRSNGDKDIFLAKFDALTGDFDWVRRAGGPFDDQGREVSAVEGDIGAEVVIVTGFFTADADFGDGAVTLSSKGGSDFFIARYDFGGNFVFAKSAGGPGLDRSLNVTTIDLGADDRGPQFVTTEVVGEFEETLVFEEGERNETTLTSNGDKDVFIAKYNQLGQFQWAKQLGGAGEDVVRGVVSKQFSFSAPELDFEEIPLQNSFIVGGFSDAVTFGTYPRTTLVADDTDIFVTRLSDFLRPTGLGLADLAQTPLENTPYVKIEWGIPFNEAAPSLSNEAIQELGSGCTFDDGSQGTTYQITVEYDDQVQADVTNEVEVTLVSAVTPFGARIEFDPQSIGRDGGNSSGTLSFEVCIRFGRETNVVVPFAIRDEAGNLSNFREIDVANPEFSNTQIAPNLSIGRSQAPIFKTSAQIEAICNGSVNLIGYNIYRQLNQANAPLEFLEMVPADQTTFVDQSTTPSTNYIYRVTAQYAEGESDHIGDQGTSGSPGSETFFERITDSEAVTGGGFSGAGVWGDFNNDDLPDLFVPTFVESPNLLFQNVDGQSFSKVEIGDVATDVTVSFSASWGDYNRDGLLDLFVANGVGDGSGLPNNLYRNVGGVLQRADEPLYFDSNGNALTLPDDNNILKKDSNSGVWGDYDNDGWLDLFVANLGTNSLWHNEGDGTFRLVEEGEVATESDDSFGAAWTDYDNDADLDLFVANFGVNSFYQNQGEEGNYNFVKLDASDVGNWINESAFTMGVSWADYDNDLDFDLFLANRLEKNVLLRNEGAAGNYTFNTVNSGDFANDEGRSFGSAWGDFDNDGDLDLYVTNLGDLFNLDNAEQNTNFLYFNDGNGSLNKIDPSRSTIRGNLIFDQEASNGCAWGDYNRDGYVDLFVANGTREGQNSLYLNNKEQGTNNSNWLNITCEGRVSNLSALGAKVRVKAQISGEDLWQMAEISGQTGGGWGGQNSLSVEFGLGDANEVDSVVVEWPVSDTTQVFTNVDVNTFLRITEPPAPEIENRAPTAVNDQASTPEDTGVTINVLNNDNDPDED